MIELNDVYKLDPDHNPCEFLYDLLKERKPYQNISHKKMPEYLQHVEFVDSRPYQAWYIVNRPSSGEWLGAVYLSKEDEVGIFLREKYKHKGWGKIVLNELM